MNSSFVGSISISWPIAILASVSSAAKHKTAHAPIVLKKELQLAVVLLNLR